MCVRVRVRVCRGLKQFVNDDVIRNVTKKGPRKEPRYHNNKNPNLGTMRSRNPEL